MSRRADKSLVKIYKDLMISKRQLIDLRQSITKTLYGLKNPVAKHPASIQNKKKICYTCGLYYEPAAAHHCKEANYKCSNCPQKFVDQNRMDKHMRENHFQCKICGQKFNQTPARHEAQLCGQKRLGCQNCGAKVKRRDFQEHIIKCCFHCCPKCKKGVYHKVYAFHISKCNQKQNIYPKIDNDMNRTKRIVRRQPSTSSGKTQRFIPCSLIFK